MNLIRKLLYEEKGLILRGWLGVVASIIMFFAFLGDVLSGNASEDTIVRFSGWIILTVILNLGLIKNLLTSKQNHYQ